MEEIRLEKGKKIYFASDFHLGIPDPERSRLRETQLVNWLEFVRQDAAEIYLMGDLFDFWFEYKTVIPKGYVRLFGKLAEITDSGLPVYLFRGNHDIWAFDYLEKEVGLCLERESVTKLINGRKFFLAHGDGLGPGDRGYKFLKKVFELKFNQWLFRWLHPDLGARMGLYFSKKSRIANIIKEGKPENHVPLEKEMLYQFALSESKSDPEIDYFVFGHRHMPVQKQITEKTELIILGDWVTNFTYGVFDGEKFELKFLGK
ncbi:MAG: UDP-2,3-diacylglucosamine diphosphatase [Bacteroidales bacterium]|nr:UDP-2,3-diacylglucosamine diphosphatase [Bacteroidales bacterium]MCF8388011.1 UDP-2,3-diacylglucosamine diphosphatase [Bacteroidales bacterium]MCF8398856.1 UDP-2,3-diacylglucosamine diphosphatase [Bacteroidales bacterium]